MHQFYARVTIMRSHTLYVLYYAHVLRKLLETKRHQRVTSNASSIPSHRFAFFLKVYLIELIELALIDHKR